MKQINTDFFQNNNLKKIISNLRNQRALYYAHLMAVADNMDKAD